MNKLYSYFFIVFLVLPFVGNAQKETNIWYFGTNIGLDFNTSPPTQLTQSSLYTTGEGEGVMSLADADGNLLFYTNGENIYDANHNLMPNGAGLKGNISSAQSAFALQIPCDPTKYLIFTVAHEGQAAPDQGLHVSTLDMTLNGGLGDIVTTEKNIKLSGNHFLMEALQVVPSSVANEYYVMVHTAKNATSGIGGDQFLSYKVSCDGTISAPTSSTATGAFDNNTFGSDGGLIGSMKFSPCQDKVAITYYNAGAIGVQIFNYDRTTGQVTGLISSITNISSQAYGLEWSPSGQYLYVTELTTEQLNQYDTEAGSDAAINASRYTWTVSNDAGVRLGALQIGPDGQIYVTHTEWTGTYGNDVPADCSYLGIIHNPNGTDAAANFEEKAICFTGGTEPIKGVVQHGLPPFIPRNNLQIREPVVCIDQGEQFQFNFTSDYDNPIIWDMGDGTIINNQATPTHTYTTAGTYDVALQLTDLHCGIPYYDTITIEVIDLEPQYSISGPSACPGTATITGTTTTKDNYVWFDASSGGNVLGTGDSYDYNMTADGSIWVEDRTPASQEVVYPGPPANAWDRDIITTFDVHEDLTLNSAKVYLYGASGTCSGTYNFVVKQGATTIAGPKAITLTCGGENTLDLGFDIPAGTGYSLETVEVVDLLASHDDYDGINQVGDALTITTPGADFGMFYAFDVDVIHECTLRKEVPVVCTTPVELIAFDAKRNNASIALAWTTASEHNSSYFEVQRSFDGANWVSIGTVEAAGYSNSDIQYSFTDAPAPLQALFYRIVEFDIDGSPSPSKMAVVPQAELGFYAVPNPGNGHVQLYTNTVGVTSAEVTIHSTIGTVVYNNTNYHLGDKIQLQAQGVYFITIEIEGLQKTIKYINQ